LQLPHFALLHFAVAHARRRADNSSMSQRVLIIPDKFKGTLSAAEAARAIARGWRRARPQDLLDLLPMSDGGDGFGEVLGALLGARAQRIKTVDAAHRPCVARWWWQAETKTAIVESARVIGLAMLPPGKFHPFRLDTFGLGALLQAAQRKGAKRIIVGIGGSATNDGGFGLARALGWRFLGRSGQDLGSWTKLEELARIVPPWRKFFVQSLVVAVDVWNPLLGPRGATRIYGPQKGIRPRDFARAERNLRRLAQVVARVGFVVPASAGSDRLKAELRTRPGAGAAGGLGFGLLAFAGAWLQRGFELLARQAQLARRLRAADVVVTGEGAIDRSTAMGKGAGQVALRCREAGVPCIGLGGVVTRTPRVRRLFTEVRSLTEVTTLAEAKARPAFWLEHLAAAVASTLKTSCAKAAK
jgi:glycerate kinase